MKRILVLLALTALTAAPVAPTGCATISTKYGSVTYTLPSGASYTAKTEGLAK